MSSKQTTQQTQASKPKAPAKHKSGELAEKPSFIQQAVQYFQAAQVELGKVSWPTWKEVKTTGYAVAALVVVMALFLGLSDVILAWLMEAILSIGA